VRARRPRVDKAAGRVARYGQACRTKRRNAIWTLDTGGAQSQQEATEPASLSVSPERGMLLRGEDGWENP
jgi:hypothetical protein